MRKKRSKVRRGEKPIQVGVSLSLPQTRNKHNRSLGHEGHPWRVSGIIRNGNCVLEEERVKDLRADSLLPFSFHWVELASQSIHSSTLLIWAAPLDSVGSTLVRPGYGAQC